MASGSLWKFSIFIFRLRVLPSTSWDTFMLAALKSLIHVPSRSSLGGLLLMAFSLVNCLAFPCSLCDC